MFKKGDRVVLAYHLRGDTYYSLWWDRHVGVGVSALVSDVNASWVSIINRHGNTSSFSKDSLALSRPPTTTSEMSRKIHDALRA